MTSQEWTDELPEPNMAYEFNIPTGGLAKNETPLYRGGTRDMTFEGDWKQASEFGLLRSKKGNPIDHDWWPRDRIFHFPANVFKPTNDPDADALLVVYKKTLNIMLETRKDTPSLTMYECRVLAARKAQAQMNDPKPS